jgi:hypothetical protein
MRTFLIVLAVVVWFVAIALLATDPSPGRGEPCIPLLFVGGIPLFIIILLPVGKVVKWLRPQSGVGRQVAVLWLLLATVSLSALTMLPWGMRLIRQHLETPEERQAAQNARPVYPPEPTVPKKPTLSVARTEGNIPGESLEISVRVPESLLGHYRPGRFFAELTLSAGKDGTEPVRTISFLDVSVTSNDWKEPIKDYKVGSRVLTHSSYMTATVRLPDEAALAGRKGKLTLSGSVSFPETQIEHEQSGEPFVRVKTETISETRAVSFVSQAQRTAARAAAVSAAQADLKWELDRWHEEVAKVNQMRTRWEAEKQTIDRDAEAASVAREASVEQRVGQHCWAGRGVAGLGLAVVVLLAWPTRRRATPTASETAQPGP